MTTTRRWTPTANRGGHKAGTCENHPRRAAIHMFQDGAWIDTGLCATCVSTIERMDRAAARAAARAERGTIAGEIGRSKSRITGTTVIVIDGDLPGADENVDRSDGRWWLICNDHGGLINIVSRRAAFGFAVDPREWCPTCQEIRDAAEAAVAAQ